MLRVMILGYGPMGLALTRGVLSCPDLAQIVGVFPWSNHPRERYTPQEASENQFQWFLQNQRLPIIKAPGANHFQFAKMLQVLQPQLVLVGSWGEILKPHVLNMPGVSFVNCHPSWLPFHRGSNPYTAVLLAGEPETGVTFHLMDTGIDTGPIVLQAKLPLLPTDTGGSLRERCSALAETMVKDLIAQWATGTWQAIPQPAGGSYDKMTPEIGWIPWEDPVDGLERRLRALDPWFEPLAYLGKHPIAFRSGRVVAAEPALSTPQQPGILVQKTAAGISVSTQDPGYHVLLQKPRFLEYPWPFTPFLSWQWLHPGGRFYNPSHTPPKIG